MADANDPTPAPDGANGKPDGNADELQKRIDALTAELEAEKQRKLKAVEDAKAERERRKKEAEEKGEYEKATAEREKEIADLKAKVAELTDLETYKQRWTEHENKRRAELLEKLPEDKRERYKDRPLDVIEDAVSLLPTSGKPGVDTGKPGNYSAGDLDAVKWSAMNLEQRAAWSVGKTSAQIAAKISQG